MPRVAVRFGTDKRERVGCLKMKNLRDVHRRLARDHGANHNGAHSLLQVSAELEGFNFWFGCRWEICEVWLV